MTDGKELASYQRQVEQSKRAVRTARVQTDEEQGWESQECSLSPGQKGTSREQGKQTHRKPDFITSTSLKRNLFVQFSCGYSVNLSNLLLDCVAIKRPCWKGAGFFFSSSA